MAPGLAEPNSRFVECRVESRLEQATNARIQIFPLFSFCSFLLPPTPLPPVRRDGSYSLVPPKAKRAPALFCSGLATIFHFASPEDPT